jgi:hypothetical protein
VNFLATGTVQSAMVIYDSFHNQTYYLDIDVEKQVYNCHAEFATLAAQGDVISVTGKFFECALADGWHLKTTRASITGSATGGTTQGDVFIPKIIPFIIISVLVSLLWIYRKQLKGWWWKILLTEILLLVIFFVLPV